MKETFSLKLLIFTVTASSVLTKSVDLDGLWNDVFNTYHKDVFPMCEDGSAVKVKIGMALRQVIDLNEPRQVLEINAWIRLVWHDCRLRWNATTYGIDHLILPFNKIWVPDITLYDNVGESLVGLKDYRPTVYSNGDVYYNFPTVITSMCPVDVTYFPFDTQTCLLKFGSWAYHGLQVDVTNKSSSGDLSSFVPSVEWAVTNISVVRSVFIYGCCPEPYPDVTFHIILDRKPLFYMMSLIFPCILITAVACLGFMLPPDSGEKVSLEITVLLSLAVFLLVVSETMPPSSENFPYIGVYFACSMLLVSCSCLMTVIVLGMHHNGMHGREMPQIVKTIFFDFLAKFVCMAKVRKRARRCSSAIHPSSLFYYLHRDEGYVANGKDNGYGGKREHDLSSCTVADESIPERQQQKDGKINDSTNSEIVLTLQKQLNIMRNIEHNLQEKKRLDSIIEEWQLLAVVLDRVFLIFFCLFLIISTSAIVLKTIYN